MNLLLLPLCHHLFVSLSASASKIVSVCQPQPNLFLAFSNLSAQHSSAIDLLHFRRYSCAHWLSARAVETCRILWSVLIKANSVCDGPIVWANRSLLLDNRDNFVWVCLLVRSPISLALLPSRPFCDVMPNSVLGCSLRGNTRFFIDASGVSVRSVGRRERSLCYWRLVDLVSLGALMSKGFRCNEMDSTRALCQHKP